jgi:hypothetical protein
MAKHNKANNFNDVELYNYLCAKSKVLPLFIPRNERLIIAIKS